MQFRPVFSALSRATSRTAFSAVSPRPCPTLVTGAGNIRLTPTTTIHTKLTVRYRNTTAIRMDKVDTTARLSQLRKLMDSNKVDVYSRPAEYASFCVVLQARLSAAELPLTLLSPTPKL